MEDKLKKHNKSGDEITAYGFISNMESFIQKLLNGNITAQTNEYLKSHGITTELALKKLLDKNNPILSRKESIKTDKETKKDKFCIKYTPTNYSQIEKQLKTLYINLFEYHITNNNLLLEDGECGDCGGGDSMISPGGDFQVIEPIGGVQRKKTYSPKKTMKENTKTSHRKIFLTTNQIKAIDEAMTTFNAGSYTYDAPAFLDKETADRHLFRK